MSPLKSAVASTLGVFGIGLLIVLFMWAVKNHESVVTGVVGTFVALWLWFVFYGQCRSKGRRQEDKG